MAVKSHLVVGIIVKIVAVEAMMVDFKVMANLEQIETEDNCSHRGLPTASSVSSNIIATLSQSS